MKDVNKFIEEIHSTFTLSSYSTFSAGIIACFLKKVKTSTKYVEDEIMKDSEKTVSMQTYLKLITNL